MADMAEKLLQAMQIVANKNLEAISFDTTIEATIEDVSQADQGKYLVSNGASKFYAYSTETNYKLHEAVMVTVPEGNYDNQKIILGKKVKDNETAIPYRSPFGHIVDITSNLIAGAHERGINVNYNDIVNGCPWEVENKTFDLSSVFQSWLAAGVNANSTSSTPEEIAAAQRLMNSIPIWDSGELATPYTGYTRIGLQAQFSTWLSTYNTTRGNYGLCLKVDFRHLDGANKGNFYNFYYFDSDSFYGDPYNFETYYTQEAVFDISEYSEYLIERLTLFLYQRNNFYDVNGELVESPTDDDFSTVMPNLYVKDPFICLGYEDDESINDTAVLFTNDSLTYYKYQDETHPDSTRNISKNIKLRWIHREEMTKELHPMESVPDGYKITWYHKKVGAASPDSFAGAHYEIIGTSDASAPEDAAAVTFEIQNYEPDVNLQEDTVKVIITRKQINSESGTQTETIVAQSNILTFVNDQQVISQADVNQLSALGIKFEDLQRGRYSIYRRDGKLQRDIDSKQIRYITAVFDYNEQGLYSKDLLKEAESVKWYYPIKNTMIKPYDKDLQKPSESNMTEDGIYGIYDALASSQYHTIGAELSGEMTEPEEGGCYQFAYTIKPTLNRTYTNNTIRLEVKKDGITYLADITMTFNVAGSSGSAYTLDILWDDEDNVINMSSQDREISGQVVLYDENGVLINIPETANLYYDWYTTSDIEELPVEEKGNIPYPCSTGTFDESSPYLEEINDVQYYYYDGNKFQEYNSNTPSGYIKYRYKQNNEVKYSFKYKKDDEGIFILLNNNYVIYENRFGDNYQKYTVDVIKRKINTDFDITLSRSGEDNNTITVKATDGWNMNSIGIFKLVLTNFGDYDLIALFPIALKASEIYQGIDGATSVRYSTLGDPDYIRNPYQLFAAAVNNDIITGLETVDAEWIINKAFYDSVFVPTLSKKNVLQPLPIYIEDAPSYAIQAVVNGNVVWNQPILVYKDNYPSSTLNQWNGTDILQNDEEGTIVANGIAAGKKVGNTFSGVMIGDWSRSDVDSALSTNTGIYGFHQGAVSYAFKDDGTAFIGKDGHGRINFNGNEGTIYSSGWPDYGIYIDLEESQLLVKGKILNWNNSHTYLEITTPTTTNNGLSYQDTKLIHIGDNQYYLQSANFNPDSVPPSGTKIDLADGRLQGYNFNIYASGQGGSITLSSSSLGKPFVVQGTNYNSSYSSSQWMSGDQYIYQLPTNSGRFAINWDGTIEASGGTFGGTINAYGGNIYGTLTVSGNLNVSGSISSNNWGTTATSGYKLSESTLTARNADISGKITATSGNIGGWEIGAQSLWGGGTSAIPKTELTTTGTISTDTFIIKQGGTNFGSLGYMESNMVLANGATSTAPGIGLSYGNKSVFKVTNDNAGFSFNGSSYFSASQDMVTMGVVGGGSISVSDNAILINGKDVTSMFSS